MEWTVSNTSCVSVFVWDCAVGAVLLCAPAGTHALHQHLLFSCGLTSTFHSIVQSAQCWILSWLLYLKNGQIIRATFFALQPTLILTCAPSASRLTKTQPHLLSDASAKLATHHPTSGPSLTFAAN